MARDTNASDDSTRIGRRKYLVLGALAATGLAGCSSDDTTAGSRRPQDNTPTATATGSPESTQTSEQAAEPASPTELTRQYYTTLYGEDDIEGTNALYHPESPAPELEPANFEAFDGLENIDTSVQSVTVDSQSDGRATVHATIEYTFPNRTTTNTDYMYLRQSGEEWRINRWFPEALRRRFARQTVVEFYTTLYEENDIEAANAMYHPDDGGPLEAASFEPYGGLEKIGTTVKSTEVVSEGDGRAEVHADVEYDTPNGTNTRTDYVYLKLHQGSWTIDSWRPEALRESESGDS